MIGNSQTFPDISHMLPGDIREYIRWNHLGRFVRASENVIGLPFTAASVNSLLDAVDLCAPKDEHNLQSVILTKKGRLDYDGVPDIGLVARLGVTTKGIPKSFKETGDIVIAPDEYGTRIEVFHYY